MLKQVGLLNHQKPSVGQGRVSLVLSFTPVEYSFLESRASASNLLVSDFVEAYVLELARFGKGAAKCPQP